MKKLSAAAFICGMTLTLAIPRLVFASAGDANKGKAVFENCAACHNADSTDAKVGPGLKGLFKREKLVNGKSVTDENVRMLIDEGTSSMPAMGDSIKADEKDDLIAYLKTL